jgi:hypothetical protein
MEPSGGMGLAVDALMRRAFLISIVLSLLLASAANAKEGSRSGAGMAAVKDHWVAMVQGHVKATNDYARLWEKPHLHAAVPTSWKDLPGKYKTPRIMRQLRAIARAPEIERTANGLYLKGKDPQTQVVRTIHAMGHGAQIETNWRGGQSGGGQTWMVYPMFEHVEKATLEHFFLRGQRAAKLTGKPAGERTKRNVERRASFLDDVTDAQVEHRMNGLAKGHYDETQTALLLVLDGQRNRAAAK